MSSSDINLDAVFVCLWIFYVCLTESTNSKITRNTEQQAVCELFFTHYAAIKSCSYTCHFSHPRHHRAAPELCSLRHYTFSECNCCPSPTVSPSGHIESISEQRLIFIHLDCTCMHQQPGEWSSANNIINPYNKHYRYSLADNMTTK